MIDASIYIHFKINKLLFSGDDDANAAEFLQNSSKKTFLPDFNAANDWTKCRQNDRTENMKIKHAIDEDYAKLRKPFNLPFYDRTGKGNMMDFAAETLRSKFKNNITEHAYDHIKRLLKIMHPDSTTKTYET